MFAKADLTFLFLSFFEVALGLFTSKGKRMISKERTLEALLLVKPGMNLLVSLKWYER